MNSGLSAKYSDQRIIKRPRVFRWALILTAASLLSALVLFLGAALTHRPLLPNTANPLTLLFGLIAMALFLRSAQSIPAMIYFVAVGLWISVLRRLFTLRTIRRCLFYLACLATLIGLFYAIENWRGRRAWEACRRELEARGEVLDWDAYVPAPVPDEQNVFAAPGMTERFVRKPEGIVVSTGSSSNKPAQRLFNGQPLTEFLRQRNADDVPVTVAELIVVPPDFRAASEGADAVLPFNDPAAREQAAKLISRAVGPSASGSQGYTFIAFPLTQIRSSRIFVKTDQTPSIQEFTGFFLSNAVASRVGHLRIERAPENNSFRVLLHPSHSFSTARDYVEWSDQFRADFDLIHEALKRPQARMMGDYQRPFATLMPNFVALRTLAQTLGQRAQCYLLLGQPEQALRELSFLHDTQRLLRSKPDMLVTAMIDVAITGLYLDVVADGLRMQAWREPQFVALQGQLTEVNLLPLIAEAFRGERAAVCLLLETTPFAKIGDLFSVGDAKMSLWQKLKNPLFLFFALAPRGWVYQNMAADALLEQKIIDSFDASRQLVLPDKLASAGREVQTVVGRFSPYTFLAAIAIPNFLKASQTLAWNQTKVSQTLAVCALERFRLAHGEYPEALAVLVPQYIDKLPSDILSGQPFKYRRTDDGHFVLYSVGWNSTDDGGVPALKRDEGDWVWQQPEK